MLTGPLTTISTCGHSCSSSSSHSRLRLRRNGVVCVDCSVYVGGGVFDRSGGESARGTRVGATGTRGAAVEAEP